MPKGKNRKSARLMAKQGSLPSSLRTRDDDSTPVTIDAVEPKLSGVDNFSEIQGGRIHLMQDLLSKRLLY